MSTPKDGQHYWTILQHCNADIWVVPARPYKCKYFVTHDGDGVIREFIIDVTPGYMGAPIRLTNQTIHCIFERPFHAWVEHWKAYDSYISDMLDKCLQEEDEQNGTD
jgi:hypothetical protein